MATSSTIHDAHRDRGYLPDQPWTQEQRAYLEDLLTSCMCWAQILEREARRLKVKTAAALQEVRGASEQEGPGHGK